MVASDTKPPSPVFPSLSEEEEKTTRSGRGTPLGRTLVVSAPGGVTRHPLGAGVKVVLGRSEDCDVRVIDDSVSRRHAEIEAGTRVTIRDLGSRNGTRVAGRAVTGATPAVVASGAVIEVGDVLVAVLDEAVFGAQSPRAAGPGTAASPVIADPKLQRVYALLDVVAPSDIAVLVLGETGTGKEVFATAVHERSLRSAATMLSLNCAALPDSILEAELFGYERGAFTGATQSKPGLFEAANGGTVFLDELGDMPISTQVKLLRVLDSGEVMRLGARATTRVDVRIVSATNRDLEQDVRRGTFRADLFFRVSGVTVTLPPLRERPLDIAALARHFVSLASAKAGRPAPALAGAALAALAAYPFPGNVRELKNIIERACVLARGAVIDLEHLALDARAEDGDAGAGAGPGDAERRRILEALEACGGNQSRAATELGISRATLVRRLDAFGIVRPRKSR